MYPSPPEISLVSKDVVMDSLKQAVENMKRHIKEGRVDSARNEKEHIDKLLDRLQIAILDTWWDETGG